MRVVGRFQGGRTLMLGALAVGVVGTGATFLGLLSNARETLFSYLFAFAFWFGLAIGALLLLATLHASKARWTVVLRRVLEVAAACCVLFPLLFVPIAAGMEHVFVWVKPPPELGEHLLHLIEHKRPYLNVPFFLVRAVAYFVLWGVVGHLLWRWSTRQDDSGDVAYTAKQWKLGAGALAPMALALSFAAEDWLMSLEPAWYSTVYSVYYFAGAFLAVFAVLTLVAAYARGPDMVGPLLSEEHWASLGKMMLAFTAFWAYIAFCQMMLIWIANIPEEVTWYQSRGEGGWRYFAIFLAVGHFVLPFFALLQRKVTRHPKRLAAVAIWILFAHAVDTYWLVMPALHPEGPRFAWTSLTAFVGLGGLTFAFALWRLRGAYAVPVMDPYLPHSLRYHP